MNRVPDEFVEQNDKIKDMTKLEVVALLNKSVILLISKLRKKYPNNGDVNVLENRVKLVKNEDREILIRNIGPLLFKYREFILTDDKSVAEKFFQNASNIDELSKLTAQKDDEMAQTVLNLFELIRSFYFSSDDRAQTSLHNTAINMLKCYIRYLSVDK